MQKEHLERGAFIMAIGWMAFWLFGVEGSGFRRSWEDMSLWTMVALLSPFIGAITALGAGYKFKQKAVGMIGFYTSAFLLSAWPGFIATLIVFYLVVRKPFLLTSILTGLAAIIAIVPLVHYKLSGSGSLLYAGAAGYLLAFTSLLACLLLISSVVSMIIHLVKKNKSKKSFETASSSSTAPDDPT